MRLIPIFESAKSDDPWQDGFDNTKSFSFSTDTGKHYLQGCRNCDKIVPLKNLGKERQMVGNVYQSLCNCAICDEPIVFDEHNYRMLKSYLKIDESKSDISLGEYYGEDD